MAKCTTDSQATDDSTKRRMRFGCWITEATHTHNMQYYCAVAADILIQKCYSIRWTCPHFKTCHAPQLCGRVPQIQIRFCQLQQHGTDSTKLQGIRLAVRIFHFVNHGSPTCGPPGCTTRAPPPAIFVNHFHITKIIKQFIVILSTCEPRTSPQ